MRGNVCHQMVMTKNSLLSRFVADNFKSFQSLDSHPYHPCSDDHSKLGLKRTYKTMLLDSRKARRRIVLSKKTIDGSTGRVSNPSHAKSKLCFTVHRTVRRTKATPRSVDFIGTRNATALCGSRVRSGTLALTRLRRIPIRDLGPCFNRALKTSKVVRDVIYVRRLGRNVLFNAPNCRAPKVPVPVPICTARQDVPVGRYMGATSKFNKYGTTVILSLPRCAPFGSRSGALPRVQYAQRIHVRGDSIFVGGRLVFRSRRPSFNAFVHSACGGAYKGGLGFCGVSSLYGLKCITTRCLLRNGAFTPLRVKVLLTGTTSSLRASVERRRLVSQRKSRTTDPTMFICALPGMISNRVYVHRGVRKRGAFFVARTCRPRGLRECTHVIVRGKGLGCYVVK